MRKKKTQKSPNKTPSNPYSKGDLNLTIHQQNLIATPFPSPEQLNSYDEKTKKIVLDAFHSQVEHRQHMEKNLLKQDNKIINNQRLGMTYTFIDNMFSKIIATVLIFGLVVFAGWAAINKMNDIAISSIVINLVLIWTSLYYANKRK